jgi:hypothetical protein
VRLIFRRYLELESIRDLAEDCVGYAQTSQRFGHFRRDSLNNRTGNFWSENREVIFENREFCLKPR